MNVEFGVHNNPNIYARNDNRLFVWLPGISTITRNLVLTNKRESPGDAEKLAERLMLAVNSWNKSADSQTETGWELYEPNS